MNSSNHTPLRVNIYAQNAKLTSYLKHEFEAVGAYVAVNKKFNKSSFTGKNVGNLPHYILVVGVVGDLGKIVKFVELTGIKLILVLPLVVSSQKNFQKLEKTVALFPNNLFCKVVWVGGDLNSFGKSFSQGFDYFLIAPHDAASCIRRIVFSFWSKKVEEFSVTDKIPGKDLAGKFLPVKKNSFYQGAIKGKMITPKTNTLAHLLGSVSVKTQPRPQPHKLFPKKLVGAVLLLVFVLSFPFLVLVAAQGLFWAGSKTFEHNPAQAQKLFTRAHTLSNFSLMLVPLPSTKRLVDTSLIGKHTSLSLETLQTITLSVLGGKSWDVERLTNRLRVNLDRVYTLASFMGENDQFRQKILLAIKLVDRLPALIGQSTPKTYLVLLQDSSQMRPTGGKIRELALISFQGGQLVETQVYSPQEIDNQIKGFVPAPSAINNYLSRESWSFADVNWDPDFSTTASKIDWFLEKSMDRKLSGTMVITENLAGIGDTKGLLTQKIEKIKKDILEDPVPFSLGFLEQVKNKNVQIYLSDALAQEALATVAGSDFGSRGDVWLGLYEANFTDNQQTLKKSNLLTIDLDKETASVLVRTSLDNTGSEQEYKGYFRLIVPAGVSFRKINIMENGKVIKTVNPEIVGRKDALEAGVYVQIPSGAKRDIYFEYEQLMPLELEDKGSLDVYWHNQAGGVVPLYVVINLTKGEQYRYNTLSGEDFFQKVNL